MAAVGGPGAYAWAQPWLQDPHPIKPPKPAFAQQEVSQPPWPNVSQSPSQPAWPQESQLAQFSGEFWQLPMRQPIRRFPPGWQQPAKPTVTTTAKGIKSARLISDDSFLQVFWVTPLNHIGPQNQQSPEIRQNRPFPHNSHGWTPAAS